jgi:Co/Zn/Cd efflux system component
MERLKRIAGMLAVVIIISFCTSMMVFKLMRNEAIEKMLTLQEMMVIQSLVASISAVQNLVNARFQVAEENLYQSLGINMAFLKQVYDTRGRMPGQTISTIINNVSKYRASLELSRDSRFNHVFKKDIIDFMSRVEKAGHEGAKAN